MVKLGITLKVRYLRLLTSLLERGMQVADALYPFLPIPDRGNDENQKINSFFETYMIIRKINRMIRKNPYVELIRNASRLESQKIVLNKESRLTYYRINTGQLKLQRCAPHLWFGEILPYSI